MAGIQPPVLVTDIDPKLAVHRSNNQNRDATPGQQAMAVALAFPETQQGKKRTSLKIKEVGLNAGYISQARFVLRNNPKLAVHRSNNQNRDATPGQKAMATAMAFPDRGKRGRGNKSGLNPDFTGADASYVNKARFVLRNNPPAADSIFPQYALDVMAGRMTLTEAYDATQKDVARREEEERQERLRMLKNVYIQPVVLLLQGGVWTE